MAAVAVYASALGALKLATDGVGKVFQTALTGNAQQFEKALQSLSPAAQKAALEVHALKPAFDELRNSVQGEFFKELEGRITSTANALAGPLRAGLTAIAQGWGVAARNVLDYVRSSEGVKNVQSILSASAQGVAGLSQATGPLAAGFLQVAAVVSDAFGAKLQTAIAAVGQRIGQFLSDAAHGGQAVSWVQGALTVFQQLGAIALNVGQILSSVFSAASGAGGGC